MSYSINSTTDDSSRLDASSHTDDIGDIHSPAGNIANSTKTAAGTGEPGFADQINPFGWRGEGLRDYAKYFNRRFPNTMAGAETLLHERIVGKVCNNYPNTQVPGLNTGAEDIDIKSDMKRFGDTPQGWYERAVRIGDFEIKTDDINVQWQKAPDGSTTFSYDTTMYVKENTGDNDLGPLFRERPVRMGDWPLKGESACAP